MKKQVISKGLYIEGLRKVKIPAIIFCAIIVVMQALIPLFDMLLEGLYNSTVSVVGPDEIMSVGGIIPIIMAPVLVFAMFFSFNKRNSSDFYQSLPYTRECLYFSWLLAALTIVAGLVVVTMTLGYGIRILFPFSYKLTLAGLGTVLLDFLAITAFTMGCTLLAMSLTGSAVPNIICTLVIMFLPRLVMCLTRQIVINYAYILSENYFARFFSITYNTFIGGIVNTVSGSYTDTELLPILYTLFVGLAYIALGAVVFKKRKSETATQSSVSRMVHNVIRVGMTLTISLLGTTLLSMESLGFLAIFLYCVAAIAFFAYEIITTRKWKNLVRSLPSLAIVIGLNVTFWALAMGITVGVLSSTVRAEEIISIRVINETASNYFAERTNDVEIADSDINEMICEVLADEQEFVINKEYFQGWYDGDTTKSERVVYFKTTKGEFARKLRLSDEQLLDVSEAMLETEEFEAVVTELPDPMTGTMKIGLYDAIYSDSLYLTECSEDYVDREKLLEVLETLEDEISEIGADKWYIYLLTYDCYNAPADTTLNFSYTENSASKSSVDLPIGRAMTPKTFEKALELLWETQNTDNYRDLLNNWETLAQEGYFEITVTIEAANADGDIRSTVYNAYGSDELDNGVGKDMETIINYTQAALDWPDAPEADALIRIEYSYSDYSYDLFSSGTSFDTGVLFLPVVPIG